MKFGQNRISGLGEMPFEEIVYGCANRWMHVHRTDNTQNVITNVYLVIM